MRDFDTYASPTEQPPPETGGMRSFDAYGAEPTAPARKLNPMERLVAGQPQEVGYGEDIGKGFVGGVGRGVAGSLGIGGTLGTLGRWGLGKAGVPEEYLDKGAAVLRAAGTYVPAARLLTGPGGAEVQKSIEDVTGKFYEPQTIPGQYASTGGEFLPGALLPGGPVARVVNTVVPAITSETAGQFTKGTAAEPWARGAAALLGGFGAAKAITPIAAPSRAYQGAVRTLEAEGIPLTAGQRTGSKPLQWVESSAADLPVVGGQAARLQTNATDALGRAVTERMFDRGQLTARGVPEGVNLPDPGVFGHGRQSLRDQYTTLSRANQLRSDPALQRDLAAAQTRYEANVLPSQRTPDIEHIRNDLVDRLIAGQGRMPGGDYQRQRSRLGKASKGMQDVERADALRDMRTALDQAMERSLSPQDAAAWRLNNQRYANMKQVGVPLAAAGGETISPLKLAQAARSGRAEQFAAQQGNMDELANAAALVMKPLPNSGTAARTAASQLFAGGGGGTIGALLGGPVGAIAGAAAPFVPPYLATTRLGQAYLGNRVAPQRMRDILAQTLTQQAISQPSGTARNRAEREAYEKRRRAR
jgi:hypothetical protein